MIGLFLNRVTETNVFCTLEGFKKSIKSQHLGYPRLVFPENKSPVISGLQDHRSVFLEGGIQQFRVIDGEIDPTDDVRKCISASLDFHLIGFQNFVITIDEMQLENSVSDERQGFVHGLVSQAKCAFNHVYRRIQSGPGGMQAIDFTGHGKSEFVDLMHIIDNRFIAHTEQFRHLSFTENLGQIPATVMGSYSIDAHHSGFSTLHARLEGEKIPTLYQRPVPSNDHGDIPVAVFIGIDIDQF